MSYRHAATLDRHMIHGLLESDPEMGAMLIEQFLQEAAAQADLLRDANQRDDRPALKSAAHNLKGSSMTMGATRLGALCVAFEAQATRPAGAEPAEPMLDLLTDLDRELVNLRTALLTEREGVSPL